MFTKVHRDIELQKFSREEQVFVVIKLHALIDKTVDKCIHHTLNFYYSTTYIDAFLSIHEQIFEQLA